MQPLKVDYTPKLIGQGYDGPFYILLEKCNMYEVLECSSVSFLADRTNGRAIATLLRLSVCLSVVCRL